MTKSEVKRIHDEDLAQGYGEVYLPDALARKYPHASREFRWHYVFPSKKRGVDPRTGVERRHRVLESGLQKAVKLAADRAGITKRIGCPIPSGIHSPPTCLKTASISGWCKNLWVTRM